MGGGSFFWTRSWSFKNKNDESSYMYTRHTNGPTFMAGWTTGANMKPTPVVSMHSATCSADSSTSMPRASNTSAEPFHVCVCVVWLCKGIKLFHVCVVGGGVGGYSSIHLPVFVRLHKLSVPKEPHVPHLDDTERFPSLAAFTPQAAASTMAAVEMLMVCAPSPPVPTMSRSLPVTCVLIDVVIWWWVGG